jgi:hypothetical protein
MTIQSSETSRYERWVAAATRPLQRTLDGQSQHR